jgi:hypothetical protein
MMFGWMMFSEIISSVQNSSFPIDMELALADAVANPVEAHVNGFGSFLFDRVIGDAKGGTVVSYNWSRRLGIAKFLKARTNRARFFAVVEESGEFGFGGTGYDFT